LFFLLGGGGGGGSPSAPPPPQCNDFGFIHARFGEVRGEMPKMLD
jgi:hypothetical protein